MRHLLPETSSTHTCIVSSPYHVAISVSWTPRGISKVEFLKKRPRTIPQPIETPAFLNQFISLLNSHFRGIPVSFSHIPLDIPSASPFDRQVWLICQQIPWGQTRSYGSLATQLNKPGGARAVGNALRRNPVPLIVPCHRVTRADGSVGGFRYGTQVKANLLRIENPPSKRQQ